MALKNNTWKLNQWYAEKVAGNIIYFGAPQLNAWGKNTSGLLGQNDTTQRSSPVQVPGTTWQYLSHTSGANDTNHVFATKTDGTLWTWGNGNVGQLGINNQTNYSSPKQVPGTTWSILDNQMSGGNNWQTAIKTDGTLWVWGYNNKGQLGQGEVGTGAGGLGGAKSSPVQVGSDTTWSKIISTNGGAAAIKTDGTLWAWGDNNYGLLGQNQAPAQLAALSSPTQITGTTWANVHTNKQSIIAVKTDGSLWSWGYKGNGQLGIDNTTAYSSPTKIAGDWKQGVGEIGSTEFGFMAIKMV